MNYCFAIILWLVKDLRFLRRMSSIVSGHQTLNKEGNPFVKTRRRATRPPNSSNQVCLQKLLLQFGIHRFFTFPPDFEEKTKLKREDLSNSGFYLSECRQLLTCYFCTCEISIFKLKSWSGLSGGQIDDRHCQQLSASCPLFYELSENVPLVSECCTNYQLEACRLFSLLVVAWRSPVSVYELARSGFYYAHPEDNVRCVFCNLEIRGWEPNDTADGEHMRWNPQCRRKNFNVLGNVEIGDEYLLNAPDALSNIHHQHFLAGHVILKRKPYLVILSRC